MAEVNNENFYLSDECLDQLRIRDLKIYLRKHNQFITGKKSELLARAKGVRKISVQVKADDDVGLLCNARRTEKLITPLGRALPDPSLLETWDDNVSGIPDFSDNDIYNYLVLKMNAKKQLRSKVYYEDRHVHSIAFHPVCDDSQYGFVRSKVIPSLPSSNKKQTPGHNVWLCLSKMTGQVHSADCNCTAGNGEACNHIAALMYALVDITLKKKDGTIASTSSKCKWNNPRKRKLSPKKPSDVTFKKYTFSQLSVETPDKMAKPVNSNCCLAQSTVNIDRFRENLIAGKSNAGWLTFFPQNPDTQEKHKLPNIPLVDFCYRDKVDLNSDEVKSHMKFVFDEMLNSLTDSDVNSIEKKHTWTEQKQYVV